MSSTLAHDRAFQAPVADRSGNALDVRRQRPILADSLGQRPDECARRANTDARLERREELDSLRSREQLDGEYALGVGDTWSAFSPAPFPIETWSSWPALVGIESTLAGWQSALFSETSAAATYCGIMKPELSPSSRARGTAAARPRASG